MAFNLQIPSFIVAFLRVRWWVVHSSVARGGAGGAIAPPIGLPTKMQNKENTTFLALLRLSFALDQTKNDLKHSLKRLFGGGGGG